MRTDAIYVHVELEGSTHLVGRLWPHQRGRRQSATFAYDEKWLEHPDRFSLEPALRLDSAPRPVTPPTAPQPSGVDDGPRLGAIGDSAPDGWGRGLMRSAERHGARADGETPPALAEADYLLGVSDEARQGALRFARAEGGSFLAETGPSSSPPLVDLPRLLSAADRVSSDDEGDDDLRLLLAPGSSLGGARPKASVRDRDGHLAIAKFPHPSDEIDAPLWEAVALELAQQAGIRVPEWRLELVGDRRVLLLRRFDRAGEERIPFLSAMSMLGAGDHEARSYLEIADAIRQHGSAPRDDLRELWRRIVFNVLIANTDDHLRNHGFLHESGRGWRLSPAYDLNPTPADVRPRVLSTAIDEVDMDASFEVAFRVAGYFELEPTEAMRVAVEVARAIAGWRTFASQLGAPPAEIERVAFESEDLVRLLQ